MTMPDEHPAWLEPDPELLARERQRQVALMQALLDPAAALPAGWREQSPLVASATPALSAGLRAYRGNAAAHAALALNQAYPVLARQVGESAWRVWTAHFWQQRPPSRGDLGEWGDGLGDWLAHRPGLAEWPWLPDLARLEWAVHRAGRIERAGASDVAGAVPGLARLADTDPADLQVRLVPGLRCLVSRWPVADIWLAHQSLQAEAAAVAQLPSDEEVAQRLADLPCGEQGHGMLVCRQGWQVTVRSLPVEQARLTQVLATGLSLGQALRACPEASFQDWLIEALRGAWLAGVFTIATRRSA